MRRFQMNILADQHHQSLFYSLQLLFEKRLKWQLFRPIGEEWYTHGFWNIFDHPDTVKQYLSLDQRFKPIDGTPPLNTIQQVAIDHYEIYDPIHDTIQKAITLDQFKEMPIDIIIASHENHYPLFARLVKEYKPTAKLIFQMGNHWPIDFGLCKNLMASCFPFEVPDDVNAVFYHQEFDVDIFHYEPPTNQTNIYSFVNVLPKTADWSIYQEYKEKLDFNFRSYGASCPDGTIGKIEDLADKIREVALGWHLKPSGDGYGHILHNLYACGRPVIYKDSHYRGKLGGWLLIDGQTGIDIENKTVAEGEKAIKFFLKDHQRFCEAAHNRFKNLVNFDNEFIYLKGFFENLT